MEGNCGQLRLDLKWTSSGTTAGAELVRIIGANGTELTWGTTLTLGDDWVAVGPLVEGADALETYADPAAEPAAFFRVEVKAP